jgi:hypothetical protein
MALAYVYDGRHKARSCHQALRRTFRDARVDLRRQVCGVPIGRVSLLAPNGKGNLTAPPLNKFLGINLG